MDKDKVSKLVFALALVPYVSIVILLFYMLVVEGNLSLARNTLVMFIHNAIMFYYQYLSFIVLLLSASLVFNTKEKKLSKIH